MKQSEVERMLIDLENRLRLIEGRELARRNYKAPQEKDILLKAPIKSEPEIIGTEINRDKERKILEKKAEEDYMHNEPKDLTPVAKPSVEQSKDLKPKEDIKDKGDIK